MNNLESEIHFCTSFSYSVFLVREQISWRIPPFFWNVSLCRLASGSRRFERTRHQLRNFGNHFLSYVSEPRLRACESLRTSKETGAPVVGDVKLQQVQDGSCRGNMRTDFLKVNRHSSAFFTAVVLSVVHTGVTVVSSDISSGFVSSKRKVFVEQTVCTHVSNCCDTDVGSRFTEDRLGRGEGGGGALSCLFIL